MDEAIHTGHNGPRAVCRAGDCAPWLATGRNPTDLDRVDALGEAFEDVLLFPVARPAKTIRNKQKKKNRQAMTFRERGFRFAPVHGGGRLLVVLV